MPLVAGGIWPCMVDAGKLPGNGGGMPISGVAGVGIPPPFCWCPLVAVWSQVPISTLVGGILQVFIH